MTRGDSTLCTSRNMAPVRFQLPDANDVLYPAAVCTRDERPSAGSVLLRSFPALENDSPLLRQAYEKEQAVKPALPFDPPLGLAARHSSVH